MNDDITKTLINASMQQISEEFFEDGEEEDLSPEEEIEQEVAIIAATSDPEENEEISIHENIDEDGYVDPYPKHKYRSAEAEIQDRLLTIPLRPKNAPWGSLWVAKTGFIDQLALLNITKSEQKALLRQWSDIEVLSQADGNEDIVESEQNEFVVKVVSHKSRSDNPEKGIRERTAHITQKNIQDQTIQMPKSESNRSGFINTILGRKINQ